MQVEGMKPRMYKRRLKGPSGYGAHVLWAYGFCDADRIPGWNAIDAYDDFIGLTTGFLCQCVQEALFGICEREHGIWWMMTPVCFANFAVRFAWKTMRFVPRWGTKSIGLLL